MISQDLRQDVARFAGDSIWLNDRPAARTLLVVYAHPDDESFGNAGTLARYAAEGVSVHYVCATRGECGTVSPEFLAQQPDIAKLRTEEQRRAAEAIGLAGVHFLNYRDSGMPGAADNQRPEALIQAPRDEVARRVTGLIRVLRPQVVLAFPPYGGYGHPDHIAMHHAARIAYRAASDPTQYAEQLAEGLEPWQPRKLYYSTFKPRMLRAGIAIMRTLGKDPRQVGENNDIDVVAVLEELTPTTTTIDCRPYLAQRDAAWRAHASQLGGMGMTTKIPRTIRRVFSGDEHYTRADPPWQRDQPIEHDLFAGL